MKSLGELSVSDYMTPQAVVVRDETLLTDAIRLMEQQHLFAVPVVADDDSIVGILSVSDLLDVAQEYQFNIGTLSFVSSKTRDLLIRLMVADGDTTFVHDRMASPVETIADTANLIVAAQKLLRFQYHHLPVVDEHDRPIGILSTSDFVRAVADYGALLAG